jgi:hypothetical protein
MKTQLFPVPGLLEEWPCLRRQMMNRIRETLAAYPGGVSLEFAN